MNKKWKALPWGNIGQLEVYRTDWFKQAGVNKFPDNWEDLLAAGRLLKKAGHPFGFELGHGFGDNHGWLYPLLWSYGGREVDKDGKTVLIDSSETAAAVDFCRKFYKETMFEDVLGWTDVNNNKAFFGEQISCTNNASSILVVGKRDFPDIAKVTDHALNPQGPKGRFHVFNPQSHAILTHAQDQAAAKAFLRWLYDDKQLSRWLVSANAYYAPFLHGVRQPPDVERRAALHPVQGVPQDLAAARVARPARPRHARRAWPSTCVVDMFAKACRGDVDQGRHRHRGDPAEADLQSEVAAWPSGRRRSRGPPRSPAGRSSLRGLLEREGRVLLAHAGARRPLPARVRRLPVLLRHLPEPARPAGRQPGHLRRAWPTSSPSPTMPSSGRSPATRSSTWRSRRCSSSRAGSAWRW